MNKEPLTLHIVAIVMVSVAFICLAVLQYRIKAEAYNHGFKAGQLDKMEIYNKKFEARYLGIGQVDTIYTCNTE